MRRTAVGLLLACGCVSAVDLDLPPREEGWASAIVAALPSFGEPIVYAFDLDAPLDRPFAANGETRFTVVYYGRSLEALGLPAGVLARPPPGVAGRRLPADFAATFEAIGTSGAWMRIAALVPELVSFELAWDGPEGCVAQRGCFRGTTCVAPCPDPSVPSTPTPIVLPEAVRLTCPSGFTRSLTETGAEACAPPAFVTSCAPGTAQRFGDTSCTPVGAACAEFSARIPANAPVRYVREGSSGDGSRAAPFGTLAEALVSPIDGMVIALGAGTYAGTVIHLGGPLMIAGACVEQTVLLGPIHVHRGSVELRDLTLRRTTGVQLTADEAGAELRLDGVVVEDVRRIYAAPGTSLSIRDAELIGLEGTVLTALSSTVALSRVAIQNAGPTAVVASSTASITLEDVVVRAAAPVTPAPGDCAVQVTYGGRARLERLLVAGTHSGVLCAFDAEIGARDLYGVGQRRLGTGEDVWGLLINGGTFTATSVVFRDNDAPSILAANADVRLRDVVLLGRGAPRDSDSTCEVCAVTTSAFDLKGAAIEDHLATAIRIGGGASRLDDVDVLGPPATYARENGGGIAAIGGRVEGTRVRLRRHSRIAIVVTDRATVLLEDLDIADVGRDGSEVLADEAFAILAEEGGTADVAGARIANTLTRALQVEDAGTSVALRDVVFQGGEVLDLVDASAVLARASVESPGPVVFRLGRSVPDPGRQARALLTDVRIRPGEGVIDAVLDAGANLTVDVERFHFEAPGGAAVSYRTLGPIVRLEDGTIRNAAVAFATQGEVDEPALLEGVRVEDVGRLFDRR